MGKWKFSLEPIPDFLCRGFPRKILQSRICRDTSFLTLKNLHLPTIPGGENENKKTKKMKSKKKNEKVEPEIEYFLVDLIIY